MSTPLEIVAKVLFYSDFVGDGIIRLIFYAKFFYRFPVPEREREKGQSSPFIIP